MLPTTVDEYRAAGYRPIPLVVGGKRPVWAGWPKVDGVWPEQYNIGLALKDGQCVLDVDERNGGNAELKKLEEKYRARLPSTLYALTPGGTHYHFSCPLGLRSKHLPGLDFLSFGSQVVAPPSVRNDGGVYAWGTGNSLVAVPVPPWILDAFGYDRDAAPTAVAPVAEIKNPALYRDRVIGGMLQELRDAQPGERNEKLNRVAYSIGRALEACGLDEEKVREELQEIVIGWGGSISKSLEVIPRALRQGMANPRSVVTNIPSLNVEPGDIPKLPDTPGPISTSGMFVSVADFLREEHPDVEIISPPFISAGSLTFIAAAPGSLKTWFVLWLAQQASRKVLLCFEEGRPFTLQKRFRMLGGGFGHVGASIRKGLRIDDPATWRRLTALIKEQEFGIVVFDPFADFHLQDENDLTAMRTLIERFKALVAETGVAVVLVHHTVKASWAASKDRPLSTLADARGTGAFMGSADLALNLVRVDSTDRNTRAADVYVVKDKDAILPFAFSDQASFRFSITFEDGAASCSCVPSERRDVVQAKKVLTKNDKQNEDAERMLKAVTMKPESSANKLAEATGFSRARALKALTVLKEQGKVKEALGEWALP